VNRRPITAPLLKSLAFLVVTVLATTGLGVGIARTGVGATTPYHARFSDVTGLTEGDAVRIAGVTVGRVEGIRIADRDRAEVSFSVERGRELPASVTASVKYLNMVGQRYVDLGRGSGPVGRTLPAGGTIPLERTTPALDLTALFNGFRPLLAGLSPRDVNEVAGSIVAVLQGDGGTVESLLGHIGSLTGTLAAKDKVIGEVIANLTTVLDTVNTREEHLTGLIVTLRHLVSGFAADRAPLGRSVAAVGELTTVTAGLLGEARQPLREDIRELGELAATLDRERPAVESFLRRTPAKMRAVTRLASYGSWLNLYLCEARIAGVTTSDGSRPPTGITITEPRCRG
jgi:phospholipid/cholesterol/gamma-HCH transport system substrate-binding protein